MNQPVKQHLIDPEICIRCYTCEMTCPIGAIEHDDNNVVVDPDKCNFCMDCIPVCPTGSIDEWRVVETPYSLEQQYDFDELPEQEDIAVPEDTPGGDDEASEQAIADLLAEAHSGAGGKATAPRSAAKPTVNMYTLTAPAMMRVQGNYRLTDPGGDNDVRHIILDHSSLPFPVLEGQSIGIIPPGQDANGKPHLPRLYSVSSPRDGERPGYGNISLTVKREAEGVCSNYVCDLTKGDEVAVTGPFGSTFLMPGDPEMHLLMICTGTGSAPFRGFTMRRQRETPDAGNSLTLFFGARSAQELPYFGPLQKVPDAFLHKSFAFSRPETGEGQYVQDRMRAEAGRIAELLGSDKTCIYICGRRDMEDGVNAALSDIADSAGLAWSGLRDRMREDGRYHVETY